LGEDIEDEKENSQANLKVDQKVEEATEIKEYID
jgi:hypothetical protein